MIGLDTNVMIAWLLEGGKSRLPPAESFRVSHVVLVELHWALTRRFKKSKPAAIAVLRRVLGASNVVIDRPEVVTAAIDDYDVGGADFNDFMIMRDNQFAGCRETLTLDQDAANKPGFKLLRS